MTVLSCSPCGATNNNADDVTTVAEGVENAETATWLQDRGCEVGQGVLYSPPITAQAVMEFALADGSAMI